MAPTPTTTQLHDLARRGVDVGEALRLITTADVRWGCDVLRPTYDASNTVDGRVSIEVDPRISGDAAKTIAEARSLWWMVDRPNLFIKIPATLGSLAAISQALAEGISINVTLIFSLDRYAKVIDAFFDGLERARTPDSTLRPSGRSRRSSSPESTPRSTSVSTRSAPPRPTRSRAKPPSRTRGSPTSCTRRSSPGRAGRRSRRPARRCSGHCGRRPASRTPPTRTRCTSSTSSPTTRSTRCPSRRCKPSTTTASSKATPSAGTTPKRSGVLDQLAAVGVDYDDVVHTLEDEGHREVRSFVDRPHRRRAEEAR